MSKVIQKAVEIKTRKIKIIKTKREEKKQKK